MSRNRQSTVVGTAGRYSDIFTDSDGILGGKKHDGKNAVRPRAFAR